MKKFCISCFYILKFIKSIGESTSTNDPSNQESTAKLKLNSSGCSLDEGSSLNLERDKGDATDETQTYKPESLFLEYDTSIKIYNPFINNDGINRELLKNYLQNGDMDLDCYNESLSLSNYRRNEIDRILEDELYKKKIENVFLTDVFMMQNFEFDIEEFAAEINE